MLKNICLTILLSILIPVSFTIMIYSKLFTESDILDNLDKMNYYDYVYKDISEKLKLELPNDDLTYVYENYLTKDQIKKDIKTIINNYYIKEKDDIKDEFYNYVLLHFEKEDDYIKELASSLTETYYNNLFRLDKLDMVIDKMPLKNSAKSIAIIGLFLTFLIMVFFIKNVGVSNSLIVSGIIFITPNVFIRLKNVLTDFYYFNDNLSYFIKMYVYNIIDNYTKCGFILMGLGLIGLTIHFIFKKQLTKNVK